MQGSGCQWSTFSSSLGSLSVLVHLGCRMFSDLISVILRWEVDFGLYLLYKLLWVAKFKWVELKSCLLDSNFSFIEFLHNKHSISPLIKLFLMLRGCHEKKCVYWNISVALKGVSAEEYMHRKSEWRLHRKLSVMSIWRTIRDGAFQRKMRNIRSVLWNLSAFITGSLH